MNYLDSDCIGFDYLDFFTDCLILDNVLSRRFLSVSFMIIGSFIV